MFKKPAKVYHYVITIEGRNAIPGEPPRIGTFGNTIEWSGTRAEAFEHLLKKACKDLGTVPEASYVKCWSFEPNDL